MSAPAQNKNGMDFITVVSVGSEEAPLAQDEEVKESQLESEQRNSGYVTVLKIGQPSSPKEIIEEVLVYRLPGERLGFGLKFEGGTKAAEFVKRLFIQSCAPDSPASMVHCSWGKLTEGDEVLNIDSLPVTSMTRIDCVRCLKDSNVVIKLLVKHLVNGSEDSSDSTDSSARITEDLPHVIGAEKKRIPPPPPPVPPRKIPRKMLKESANVVANANLPTDVDETIVNGHRNPRFHSPRSSGKFAHSRQSPEVSRHGQKDRRPSDGSIGPPDAEVYLDLFSQESGCSLSESDDTGSSISTIIDRFGSFPTTTNSSLAGSLPSTPTSIQKKLDISNILSPFDKSDLDELSSDNYLFTKLTALENGIDEVDGHLKNDDVSVKLAKDVVANEEATPLQPPTSFQDAPLSYGNESVGLADVNELSLRDMKYVEISDENGNCLKEININKVNKGELSGQNKSEIKRRPPPPPPPCEKQKLENKETNEVEVHPTADLPRLVDFVPKCNKTRHQIVESINVFLENEIRHSELLLSDEKEKIDKENVFDSDSVPEMYNPELYNLTWSLSPQLATIGEDDEEGCQESYFQKSPNAAPIVVIENTDTEGCETENSQSPIRSNTPDDNETKKMKPETCQDINMETSLLLNSSSDACEAVEGPPSSSRQPPDGDEFPDYHETPITPKLLKIEDHSKLQLPWAYNGLWKNNSSVLFRDQQSSCSVRDKIAIFSSASKSNDLPSLKKICKSTDDIFSTLEKERLGKDKSLSNVPSNKVKRSASTLCKSEIVFDSNEKKTDIFKELNESRSSLDLPIDIPQPRLHTRSQSLMDINSVNQMSKKDRWNLLAEQRQRNLSKLKGLIIPEKVVEVDVPNVVDLPEIKSSDINSTSLSTTLPTTTPESPIISCQRNLNVPSLTTPPWSCNTNSVPKYSPAFKRKSLQLHHEVLSRNDVYTVESRKAILNGGYEAEIVSAKLNQKPFSDKPIIQPDVYENHDSKLSGGLCLTDAPKSLESITSPTRSDCSFEYVTTPDTKSGRHELSQKMCHLETRMGLYSLNKGKEDVGRFEDESDNDSAVSSSQSSYISRTSPPTSPSHLHSNFTSRACGINESDSLAPLKCHSTGFQPHSQSGDNQNHRLLKPQSVEAINRKNILASAKCRSGRDLKIGSPLIQRKFDDESNNVPPNNVELEHNGRTTAHENVDIPSDPQNEVVVNSKIDLSNGWSRKQKPVEEKKVEKVEIVKTVSNDVKITPKMSKVDEKSSKDVSPIELSSHERKVPIPKSLTKEVRSTSVTDLRKSFEKLSPVQTTPLLPNGNSNKNNSFSAIKNNQFRKTPPNTQLPTKQDKELVSQTIQQLHEQGYSDVEIIILRPEIPGGSVGITLAGGADYENKEITVYKIREDSSAHRDGRLQKGDKIAAINGKGVKGLTHKQLVALLKEPLPEVTLAVNKQEKTSPAASVRNGPSSTSAPSTKQKDKNNSGKRKVFTVPLEKDAAGLGLSLEGGQDSLLGSVPLQIKKIFKGGAAEKCGNLFQGDELLLVNETDVTSMSRFEVWSILKKLPEGVTISLTVRR